MTEPPSRADHRRAAQRPLARNDRAHRRYVIRLGRVAQAHDESEKRSGHERDHRRAP